MSKRKASDKYAHLSADEKAALLRDAQARSANPAPAAGEMTIEAAALAAISSYSDDEVLRVAPPVVLQDLAFQKEGEMQRLEWLGAIFSACKSISDPKSEVVRGLCSLGSYLVNDWHNCADVERETLVNKAARLEARYG